MAKSTDQKQQAQPVAIITGAATGIGEATARALQAAGYRVFGTYRKLPATEMPGVDYLLCDVTSDQAVEAAVHEVLAKAGRIDLLVNNAGIGLVGAAEESSLEQAKSVFDVNLFGVIRMTKAVLPSMRKQRSGRRRWARSDVCPGQRRSMPRLALHPSGRAARSCDGGRPRI